MINKSVFEDDLIAGMQRKLAESDKQDGMDDLPKAVDYINSAIDIFEELGMNAKADAALNILTKLAKLNPKATNDSYSPKSSEEMIKNLLDHGTVFNNVGNKPKVNKPKANPPKANVPKTNAPKTDKHKADVDENSDDESDAEDDVFDADFSDDLEVDERDIPNSSTFEDD